MVTLTPTQVADLKAKIAAKYQVAELCPDLWCVIDQGWYPMSDNNHRDELDAEAEMEAIIEDEVKAAMEDEEDVA